MTATLPAGRGAALLTGRGCPELAAAAIAEGAPVLTLGRGSSPSGRKAYTAAGKGWRKTVRRLDRNDILPDLEAHLPTLDAVIYRLQHECVPRISTDKNGRVFEHRFLVMRSPDRPQVHISIATGSGVKIDDLSWHNPATLHAAEQIRKIKPVLVCAAEPSRWSRSPNTIGPFIEAMEELEDTYGHPAFLSMEGGVPKPFTGHTIVEFVDAIREARAEAKRMRERTTSAVRDDLPKTDLGGYCPYPFSSAPPPGLAVVWLKGERSGSRGEYHAVVDTPSVWGKLKKKVTYGAPKVFVTSPANSEATDNEGKEGNTKKKAKKAKKKSKEPVDQLALVREFWAKRGRPEWPLSRLIPSLASRGLSTVGLRRLHEDDYTWRGQTLTRNQIWAIAHSLEKHLDFYHDGKLYRGIGDGGEPALWATLLPPDGQPYLTEEDYHRVKAIMVEHSEAYRRAHRYTFGHHPVVANGRPSVLIAERDAENGVAYCARALGPRGPDKGDSDPAPPRLPAARMPADDFATSLVQAMVDHRYDLRAFVPPADPERSGIEEHLTRLEQQLDVKQRARSRWRKKILAMEDGQEFDQLLKDISADYEHLVQEIDALQDAVTDAHDDLERAARQHDLRTIEVTRLLEAVSTLGDPEDLTFHDQWHDSVRDLTLTSRYVTHRGSRYARTEWAGTLLMRDGIDQRSIPFHGASERACKRKTRAAAVVDDVRLGKTHRLTTSYWQSSAGRELLREALGVPSGLAVPVLTIRDPRLLRIAMATIYPPRAPIDAATDAAADAAADAATDVFIDATPPPPSPHCVVGPPLLPEQLSEAAQRLGEPLPLLLRVMALNPVHGHADGATRKWQTAGDRAVARVCQLAARRHGRLAIKDFDAATWADLRHAAKRCDRRLFTFPRGQIVMSPCPTCGSFRRGYLTIREATEPVCWDCRLDLDGIAWPPKPYDRYRAKP